MNLDIDRLIKLVDKEIEELSSTKRALIEMFNVPVLEKTRKRKGRRKPAIIKLLKERGPLTRGEIIKYTGFPEGTVAYILNDKSVFVSKNGKWYLVEYT